MIKLYDLATKYPDIRFSPFCWRIKYALAHKGLVWKEIPICFTEKDLLPKPNEGKVPVLIDDDHVVFDSWDIALYLDRKYPKASLFDGNESRAQSLFVKNWTETVLHSLVSRMGILDFYDAQKEPDKKHFRKTRESRFGIALEDWGGNPEAARVEFLKALDPLRHTLRTQNFLGGLEPNFSDYIMVGIFQWMRCGSRLKVFEVSDDVFDYQERLLDLFDGLGRSSPAYASIG
ncbi:MAG: glutathione S-transferase N-terminal domain-containing protein [Burkholderiales bacterium]|nr:glutathione S-transferase N-terminal domain-containing protein [Burkholderiales bacterium]OUT77567.1 MAG: hypothetical protein CBB82_05305 [Betaproteobacteria bacterium TMED22]|tara:strand:+ start:10649 stop:11344 length:696 start_codon:yes stop_codon:yes gene_type:complete